MALIVEDGTGLSTAEAYISVADADTYFAARGNAAWAVLTPDQKEQSLRLGADYIEANYAGRWQGERATSTQALAWPRTCVWVDGVELASDAVPASVARANAEMALRASAGDLLADVGAQVTQETVGPISVSYAAGARQQTKFAAVDAMLAPLCGLGAGQVKVVRA